MSEEEKKAIKILQEEHDVMINPKLEAKYTSDEVIEALYNVIMLVRRQQKEIEGLKEMKPLQDLIDTNIIIADYSHNYISKDKIRELLKSKDIELTGVISYRELEELLEENDE